jgi:hypothetical protein
MIYAGTTNDTVCGSSSTIKALLQTADNPLAGIKTTAVMGAPVVLDVTTFLV